MLPSIYILVGRKWRSYGRQVLATKFGRVTALQQLYLILFEIISLFWFTIIRILYWGPRKWCRAGHSNPLKHCSYLLHVALMTWLTYGIELRYYLFTGTETFSNRCGSRYCGRTQQVTNWYKSSMLLLFFGFKHVKLYMLYYTRLTQCWGSCCTRLCHPMYYNFRACRYSVRLCYVMLYNIIPPYTIICCIIP